MATKFYTVAPNMCSGGEAWGKETIGETQT